MPNGKFPANDAKAERLDLKASGFSESSTSFQFAKASTRRPLLGALAIQHGLIGQEALDGLLELQKKSSARLGEIMVSAGHVRLTDLTRLLSEQAGIAYVDLRVELPDVALTQARDIDFYIEHECLPWRTVNGETIYVAADPTRARQAIEEREGRPCMILFSSPRVIHHTIRERYYFELSERARLDLALTQPDSSARYRISALQFWSLLSLFVAAAGFVWLSPSDAAITFNILCGICFLSIGALKGLSIFFGYPRIPSPQDKTEASMSDADLPLYSIIVPLFREAAVLPILTDALCKLDYPAAKLQILMAFEETDFETYEAAKSLRLPDHIEFIRVPHSLPLTKPKACNYVLPFARGKYIVVYDAEDLPDPDQLKKAVAAFEKGDEKLACVQARLTYYNFLENWMTRQFTLEYATLFDLILPMLEKFGLPIPLGGTSTHFRATLLRKAGAWDPFNVTEDADLGMRIAMLGWRTTILQSTTHEEANCQLDNWLRQRSRWIKGWMQTYLVRMRHPIVLFRALGLKGFLGFQVMIGGFPLSSLIHPIFYLSILINLAMRWGHVEGDWVEQIGQFTFMAGFNILVLVSGYSLSILAGMAAATNRGLRPLILSSLTMPIYWLLISAAAYRALFQLFSRPFHWEKTNHGLSRQWPEKHASALHEMSQQNNGNRPSPVRLR